MDVYQRFIESKEDNKRVDVKICFLCNNHCSFCVQGEKRKNQPSKKLEEIARILKGSFRNGCHDVVLTGGEPTLHPYFLEVVSLCRDIGFRAIMIQSNGRSFFYEDFCKKTIRAGANQFGLSLHGHNKKIHDELTGAPGSFEQTTKGIKNLVRLNQTVIMNVVITSKNYKYLPRIAEELHSLGVNQYQFAFPHMGGSALANRSWLVPKKTEVAPYLKKALQKGIDAGKIVMAEAMTWCTLPGYGKYLTENFIPDGEVHDINFELKSYKEYRLKDGKIKRKECQKCIFNHRCEGPWKEYPELYGWEEFKPILS